MKGHISRARDERVPLDVRLTQLVKLFKMANRSADVKAGRTLVSDNG
jgi:hypothetical protein